MGKRRRANKQNKAKRKIAAAYSIKVLKNSLVMLSKQQIQLLEVIKSLLQSQTLVEISGELQ